MGSYPIYRVILSILIINNSTKMLFFITLPMTSFGATKVIQENFYANFQDSGSNISPYILIVKTGQCLSGQLVFLYLWVKYIYRKENT